MTAFPSRRWRSAAPTHRPLPRGRAERPGRYWRGSITRIRRSPTRSRCVSSMPAPAACRSFLPARSAPMALDCLRANRRSRARSKASTSMPAPRSSSMSRRTQAPCSTPCWRKALRLRIAAQAFASATIRSAPSRSAQTRRARGLMKRRISPGDWRRSRATVSAASSQSPTDASFTMPAARRRRNWRSFSPPRLPICARSKRKASRSMPHAA